jgi:hypothetical protein
MEVGYLKVWCYRSALKVSEEAAKCERVYPEYSTTAECVNLGGKLELPPVARYIAFPPESQVMSYEFY